MKTVRQVEIADHLWEALSRMAEEMGSDPEALLNQALHQLASQHGYLPLHGGSGAPSAGRSERLAVAERVLETAARLERAMHDRTPSTGATPLGDAPGQVLRLRRDDGAEVEVARDRFLIGRGRHCDLVIDSGKVSREHAALVREADGWWIEDLGSANGTWFGQERVKRRRIEDGDEYYVCAERIRCALA